MDNSKKSVHNSGPLGMLVKTGQIKKVELQEEEPSQVKLQHVGLDGLKAAGSYFKTESGINFNENELVFVDPEECEPWEYANRSDSEMGDIDELVKSIQANGQLQPALVRSHPRPHAGIKYQIIFGRRRHAACLMISKPFLVIRKDSLSMQESIACQDAENKFRRNVSNYSNAMLYKKLLENKVFKTEKELAEKLRISTSSMNELMAYVRLPDAVVRKLPNVHQLSTYMANKIVRLLAKDNSLLTQIVALAPEIGKAINTPAKLDQALLRMMHSKEDVSHRTQISHDHDGQKLFTFRIDHKGVPTIIFHRRLLNLVNFDEICQKLQHQLETYLRCERPN